MIARPSVCACTSSRMHCPCNLRPCSLEALRYCGLRSCISITAPHQCLSKQRDAPCPDISRQCLDNDCQRYLSQTLASSEMHMSNDFRFNTIPTAIGWIARAAFARASERLDVVPLLKRAGLTLQQVKNPDARKKSNLFSRPCGARIVRRISRVSACPEL